MNTRRVVHFAFIARQHRFHGVPRRSRRHASNGITLGYCCGNAVFYLIWPTDDPETEETLPTCRFAGAGHVLCAGRRSKVCLNPASCQGEVPAGDLGLYDICSPSGYGMLSPSPLSTQNKQSPWQSEKSWIASPPFPLTVQLPSFVDGCNLPLDSDKMSDDNISGFLDAGYNDGLSPFNQLQSSLDSPHAMPLESVAPRRARTLPGLAPVQLPSPVTIKMEDMNQQLQQMQVHEPQPMQQALAERQFQLDWQLRMVQEQLKRQRHLASPLNPGYNFPAQPSGFASSLDSPNSDYEFGGQGFIPRILIPSSPFLPVTSVQTTPVLNSSAPSTPRDWFRNSPTAYA
jgi:hypothetical protein